MQKIQWHCIAQRRIQNIGNAYKGYTKKRMEDIIDEHQVDFRQRRSTTEQIFLLIEILEEGESKNNKSKKKARTRKIFGGKNGERRWDQKDKLRSESYMGSPTYWAPEPNA